MKLSIDDYYTIVYLMGWVVVTVGIYMIVKAGLSGANNSGYGVFFGGLYMTAFVRNSQLKLKVAMMEKERDE